MRILITGSKGQLGSELIKILKSGKSEIGIIPQVYKNADIIEADLERLDISNFQRVNQFIAEVKPDIIINTAAYTNVDGCETNRDQAFMVNSLGPRNIAVAAEEQGSRLVHISTDYVFKGNASIPYSEYDMPNPVSVYGKTKLLGENYIRDFCSRYFIVRTAWLYGTNGNNFVKAILRTASEKGSLEVVTDQRGNPTNAEDLAFHILKLAAADEYGIYHCTGKGQCSWYDFAKTIVDYAGLQCNIKKITSKELKRVAERPEFSSLDNLMLRCTVGDDMRHWQEALKAFINLRR